MQSFLLKINTVSDLSQLPHDVTRGAHVVAAKRIDHIAAGLHLRILDKEARLALNEVFLFGMIKEHDKEQKPLERFACHSCLELWVEQSV